MVGFRTNLHGLSKTRSTSREEHEFLERELIASMRTAVDDVESWARKHIGGLDAGELGQVLVHGYTLLCSASLGDRDGETEDSVSTVFTLVGGTVQFDEKVINLLLLSNLEARLDQRRAEDVVDVCNSLGDTCSRQGSTVSFGNLE